MTTTTLRSIARLSYVVLIVLTVLWETWLAPSRSATFWLIAKLLPLLLPLPGMLQDRLRAYVYACLIALLYLVEATVLAYTLSARPFALSEPRLLAWIELALVGVFFISAVFYVRRRRTELSGVRSPAGTGS